MTVQNKTPLLSFAIPTYNFGKYITNTVQSIENGATILKQCDFEIVILDGGSTDNTEQIVKKIISSYPNVRYIKQNFRGGIDQDINTVADLTIGEYIWLFSADDILVSGWDSFFIKLAKEGGDVFLIPAELCDVKMNKLRLNPIIAVKENVLINPFQFDTSVHQLTKYIRNAHTLEAFFSFMSAVVVKKNYWDSLPKQVDYFGTCWAHCARLMPLFFNGGKIIYLNKFLIKKRGENDSFMENGFVNRIGITFDGWNKIISNFFVLPEHRMLMYKLLRKSTSPLLLLYAKIAAKNKLEAKRIEAIIHSLYYENNHKFYFIHILFKLIPRSPIINNFLIEPFLPWLQKIRHRLIGLSL